MNHRKANRMTVGFHREQHGMTRIDIDTGIPFEQFIAAFEKAAPPVDPTTLERIVKAGGDWDDVRAAAAENAPNDLMMYAKIDASGCFGVAGHSTQAIEYLVGNHVIAETMFRQGLGAVGASGTNLVVWSADHTTAAVTTAGVAAVAATVADHLAAAARRHRALDDALDIHGQQHHPVGRDALEVGGNQISRHHLRVLDPDPDGREDIGDGRREPLRIDRDGRGASRLRRHQRASFSMATRDA